MARLRAGTHYLPLVFSLVSASGYGQGMARVRPGCDQGMMQWCVDIVMLTLLSQIMCKMAHARPHSVQCVCVLYF